MERSSEALPTRTRSARCSTCDPNMLPCSPYEEEAEEEEEETVAKEKRRERASLANPNPGGGGATRE